MTTATKQARTPGPYRVGINASAYVLMIGESAIAGRDAKQTRAKENMDEVVRRCNAHDAHVARIAELEGVLRYIAADSKLPKWVLVRIAAALAKVQA